MDDTYEQEPTMVQVVLAELKKIPEAIINEVDGKTLEVVMMQMAVKRTLEVVERFMDISYEETDLIPPVGHDGPDIQLMKVSYIETIDNLSEQYWNEVSN